MCAMNLSNVLLVSLDSVRSDVAYSGKFPSIERLRDGGVCFEKVVSPAPLTPVSHTSILTGLFPVSHGIRHLFLERLFDGATTLASILREQGYLTHAIVSCPGMNSWYGLNQGFDIYDDRVPLGADGRDALHTVDVKSRGRACKKGDEVLEKAIGFLEDSDEKKFFLFLHFFDAHWPYEPPMPFSKDFKDNLYEGEVAYMDHLLGQLIDELEARGLMEDLLLVLTSDHGEDLGGLYPNDHAGESYGHPEEEGHGCLLYDSTQLVPLIFYSRHFSKHVVKSQVRLVDIMPTVLELLKINCPPNLDGTSLASSLSDEMRNLIGYCETHYPRENPDVLEKYPGLQNLKAVRVCESDSEYKVIWQTEGNGVEVYNLREDPNERVNLARFSIAIDS